MTRPGAVTCGTGLLIGAVGITVGLALAWAGGVLAMARVRTGSLWVPIGIHATWVAAFRVGRLFFEIRSTPEWLMGPGWPPLVGGVAGWVAVAIAGVLLVRCVPAGRIFRL